MKAFNLIRAFTLYCVLITFAGCNPDAKETTVTDKKIKRYDTKKSAQMAAAVDSLIKPVLADSLQISLWGIDSLVISPIAIDIDDSGKLYYTTTNRQKNSEFDIRGHQDWEIRSITLQTIEDKRAFLHDELSPQNSKRNTWLKDLNGDSSHDWKDMTIEKENVYRVEDLDHDGVADQTQLIVNDFNDEVTDIAGGVLANEDDLYVAVGPDLWKMKDKNGDGIEDEKTSLSHGYGVHIGFGGHGMSGVEMGPDGRIYWQIGDIGFNGKDKDGRQWSYPNSGVIARSNPDGSDFEIFASGNRNTHEFVFDQYANLISEDNDGDHPGERERLVYVVDGADIGWRSNWQYGKYNDPDNNKYKVWMDEKMWMPRWAGQTAAITPCIDNFVSGPAGMVYNPGTALSSKYKNTFFIAEFVGTPATSGVHSFKLNPKGASFTLGENKMIASGILPTGLDFGPDGALYIADWIDGWNTHDYGRIWKLDDKDAAASAERLATKDLLAADFKKKTPDELFALLSNADMRVRLKTQFELVKRKDDGAKIFTKALTSNNNQLARIHAIWGLCQLGRQDKKYAQGLPVLLQDNDAEIKAQAAKWLGDIRYKAAGEQLLPLLKDTNSRVRFFAAEALGRIQYEPAINPIIDMLKSNNDEDAYLRHAGALALSRIGKPEPLIALSGNPSVALRIAAVVALRRMQNPGVAVFLNDANEFVVTEAARAINDDLSITDALPALANQLNKTQFKNEALIRRCINANLRVGTDLAMQNLVMYIQNQTKPAAMRAEAIEALSTWAKPSVLDRVDGRYRGVIHRDSLAVKAKTGDALIQLLKNNDTTVRLSAVKAVNKLGISKSADLLMALLKNDRNAEIRAEALKALAAMQSPEMATAIQQALSDKDKKVRIEGINLVSKLNIPKDLMASLLTDVIKTKTTEEKQAALLSLGNLPVQYSKPTLENLIQQMAAGKLSSEIYLELNEAVDSSHSQELLATYNKTSTALSPDSLMAAYAGSLSGGDPQRGAYIFYANQNAQCLRCHSFGDYGGNAAPKLNGVASRLTRSQILEALVNPDARIAPGFGTVTLMMKDGKMFNGILSAEDAKSLTIKLDEKHNQVVQKTEVQKRINGASGMPQIKDLLTKKEIRDVVSFLSTQKEK